MQQTHRENESKKTQLLLYAFRRQRESLLLNGVVGWPGWMPGVHQNCSITPLLSWTEERNYKERLVG